MNKVAQIVTGLATMVILAGGLYYGFDKGNLIIIDGKNNKYSFVSFKRQSFVNVPVKEFDSSEIIGSSFYQDIPYSKVFPDSIKGVKFINCNLDNCIIPIGAIVIGGTNKHFKVMNDQEYWIVDKNKNPIIPLDTIIFKRVGISINPRDISIRPLSEPITITYDPDLIMMRKLDVIINDKPLLISALKRAGEL